MFKYFADECSEFSNLRKTTYLIEDPSEVNGSNSNNKRRENSRHFRSKGRKILNVKLNILKQIVRVRIMWTCVEE